MLQLLRLLSVGRANLLLDNRQHCLAGVAPLLQRAHNVLHVLLANVSADRVVHLQLTVLLVQFAVNNVRVDGLNDEVLQVTHIGDVQLLEETGIRNALVLDRQGDNGQVLELLLHSHGEFQDLALILHVLPVRSIGEQVQCVVVFGVCPLFELWKRRVEETKGSK